MWRWETSLNLFRGGAVVARLEDFQQKDSSSTGSKGELLWLN